MSLQAVIISYFTVLGDYIQYKFVNIVKPNTKYVYFALNSTIFHSEVNYK